MIPVPGLQLESQPEGVLRRMVAWGEARGEGALGMLAVLCVVRNRALKKGKTESSIILAPLQFSSFNEDDANRAKLVNAYKDDPRGWAAADAVAALIESQATLDVTLGATHYYVLGQVDPPWGRRHPGWRDTVVLGKHVFGVAA